MPRFASMLVNSLRGIFNKATSAHRWYEIRNASKDVAEIRIMDEIGGWGISARHLVDQISSIPENTRIKLHIFSDGGDVLEGNEIYNALKAHKGGVDVTLGAMCASIATVIACAGDTITMAENGLFMIHNPWTIAMGESEDLRRIAGVMDKMKTNIVDTYAKRTGLDAGEIASLMSDESWFTSAEAKEKGFIDAIGKEDPEGEGIEDKFDLGRFKNGLKALSRIPRRNGGDAAPPAKPSGNAGTPPEESGKPQPKPNKPSPTLADSYAAGKVRVFN